MPDEVRAAKDGADTRTTEERFADAFREAVSSGDPDRVSVGKIAHLAGLTRAAFYNHFKDKEDLLLWILREQILEPVMTMFRLGMYREATILIFRRMEEDRAFFERIVNMTKPVPFREISCACITSLIEAFLQERDVRMEHPWLTTGLVAEAYADSISFVLIRWIRSGMALPHEEMWIVYDYLATHPLWDVLGNIGRDAELEAEYMRKSGIADYGTPGQA